MDSTIAQADTTEFIMLRKNSSRGDFLTPMQKRMTLKDLELTLPSGQQQQLAVPSPTTPVLLLGRSPKFPWNRKQQSSICSTDGGANKDEFNVYRIHKYKPKWPAKLAFKQDTIEVLPSSGDRKNSIFKQTYKQTVIALESIGGAEIAEERPFGKKLVRISYQPMDGKHEWKTLQLEAELDDTWQIVSKVNDQIDANKSPARLAYLSRTPTKKLSSFLQFASSSPRLLPRRSSEISPTAKKSPQTAAFGNR
uniref:SAPK-interacting protein 1 Pleckstrin-homology domain-containing protein n=1 Tax=Plectus sambesii TaxID=2011161 RepID=A0A914XKH6_9BILA